MQRIGNCTQIALEQVFVEVCSDVGKERDIIRKPPLLQLPRPVSRALGHVIEEGQKAIHDHPTIRYAQNELKKKKLAQVGERFL